MAQNPPDVDVPAGMNARFNTGTGAVSIGATSVNIPNFLIPAPSKGAAVRVFVVHDLHVGMGSYVDSVDSTSTDSGYTSAALAIAATGTITMDGTLAATTGASLDPACMGEHGNETDNGTQFQTGASGGGGFATAGASGTGVNAPGVGGGSGGGMSGTVTLVPLRGGCPAGGMQTR